MIFQHLLSNSNLIIIWFYTLQLLNGPENLGLATYLDKILPCRIYNVDDTIF